MAAVSVPFARGKRVLFRAVVLAVGFVVLELAVRALAPAPLDFLEQPSRLLVFDAERGYALRPNARDFTVDRPCAVNSAGFRDREIALEKPEGTRRIACIGDSYTFGWGVDVEASYPKALERALNGGRSDGRFEALNLGVYGYDARQALATLRNVGLRYGPDVVIYGFYWDDLLPIRPRLLRREGFEARMTELDRSRPAALRSALRRVRSFFVLVDRARSIAAAVSPPETPFFQAYRAVLEGRDAEIEDLWRAESVAIAEMRDAARQRGARLVVLVWPLEAQVYRDLPACRLQERARRIAEASGATVIDLLPVLRALRERGCDPYLPYERHPTPEAYEACARRIASALVESRAIQ